MLHSCPEGHAPQVAPPVPHEPIHSDAYASHGPFTPPLQQPVGHVSESQVQLPSVVSQTPFEQVEHAAPPAPHCEGDCDE